MTGGATERWFYGAEGRRKGPVSRDQLVDLLLTGELAESALVWCTGFPEWKPASEVPDLNRELPPPLPLPAPEEALTRAALELADRDEPVEDEGGPEDGAELVESTTPEPISEGPTGEPQLRKRTRHRRRIEERYVILRDQRTLLLWAWPVILLTAVIVWLVLNRANRGPESPLILEPGSSFERDPAPFTAVFLEEPLPQTAPGRYTHANATGES